MVKLTWAQAAAWRLRQHHLDRRAAPGSMLPVASRLCGLHAQVMSSAELTVWARVEKLERGAVQRALWEERTLVKTWAMRGTLHLLPADEQPRWPALLSASAKRRYLRPGPWQKYFGITIEELERLTEAIGEALDGRLMTREELVREVGRRTGSAAFGAKIAESSWGTILKPAAFTGRLCFGPSVGQRVRFTRPDTWLSAKPRAIDPDQAHADIARRFLAGYGPATPRDLSRWSHSGVSIARKWMETLGDEATRVEVDGAPAWMLAVDARKARRLGPLRSVRLLPGFDQYVVGASCHVEHLLPGDLRSRVFRPQGWISPVLLVNGLIRGVWRHEIKRSRVEVIVEPFVKAPAWVRRGAEEEAERLAEFLGGTLVLEWKG